MDNKVKSKNLIFLNECGLDPGIDHIATMKLNKEITEKGGKIINYQSYCGALTAPEYLEGNPFGYKFTWFPLGVLKALKNTATFLSNNKTVHVDNNNLLHMAQAFPVNDFLNLVIYPNRNSVIYKDLYNLKDAQSIIRGTIRYKGFCEILAAFNDLGLLSEKTINDTELNNWPKLIKLLVSKKIKECKFNLSQKNREMIKSVITELNIESLIDKSINVMNLSAVITDHQSWKNLSEKEFMSKLRIVFKGFMYLHLLEDVQDGCQIQQKKSLMTSLCVKMEKYLTIKPGERDLVIMTHFIEAEYQNNKKEFIKSSMVITGDKNGVSAVGKTVGYTCAIATKNVLEGKINTKGVVGPFYDDIYESIGEELLKMDLFCKEYKVNMIPRL